MLWHQASKTNINMKTISQRIRSATEQLKKKKGKIIFLHIAEERFLPTETRAEWQEVVRCWESLRSPPNQRGETSLSTLVIQLRPQKGHSLPHLFVWNYFLEVYSEHFKDWFRLLLYQLDYDCFTFHSVK